MHCLYCGRKALKGSMLPRYNTRCPKPSEIREKLNFNWLQFRRQLSGLRVGRKLNCPAAVLPFHSGATAGGGYQHQIFNGK
jgi:hypothetical protein